MIDLNDLRPEVRKLICFFLIAHGFTFAFPLLSLLTAEASGLKIEMALGLLSAAVFLTSFLGPWASSLMDRGKGRPLCLVSIAGYGAGIAALILGQEAGLVFLGLCLTLFLLSITIQAGIGSLLIEGLTDSKNRGRVSTIWATGGNIGMIVSSLLGLWLLPHYKAPLLIMDFVTTSLFLGYAAVIFNRQDSRTGLTAPLAFQQTLRKIGQHPAVLGACALLYTMIFAQIYLFPMMFKQNGLESFKLTNWMGSLNSTIVVIMGIIIARGLTLKGLRAKTAATCGLMAAGFAWMPLAHTYGSVALATLVWSIGEITIYAIVTQIIFDMFPPEHASLASSLKVFLFRLGQVIAPIMALLVLLLPSWLQAITLLSILVTVWAILEGHIRARSLHNA